MGRLKMIRRHFVGPVCSTSDLGVYFCVTAFVNLLQSECAGDFKQSKKCSRKTTLPLTVWGDVHYLVYNILI